MDRSRDSLERLWTRANGNRVARHGALQRRPGPRQVVVTKDGHTPRSATAMNHHTANGEDLYFRVLFPAVGRQGHAIHVRLDDDGTDKLHSREADLAHDICQELWRQREALRESADPGEPRIRQIELSDHPVRGVRVSACLDCPWVIWEWSAFGNTTERWKEHPDGCLGDELQLPDGGHGRVPAVRITPDSVDLQAGEWGPYYDWVRPRRLMREGYGIVGSLNHAYRQASDLWARRERIRAATDPDEYLGRHHCVALPRSDDGKAPPIMACLTCTWIESTSRDEDPQKLARRHEREAQQRDGIQFATWESLVAHFGEEEALAAAIGEACEYDEPWVEFRQDHDGHSIVVDAPHVPHSWPSVMRRVPFPLSEAGLWRIVSDLGEQLTKAVEEIPLPHIDEYDVDVRTALIDALVEELPALTPAEVLASIGGGWASCDDKISEPGLKHRRWFSIGHPAPLAVIALGRRKTYIDRIAHAGPNTPTWKLDGTGIEVDTRSLLTGSDEDGPNYLRGVIAFSKRSLKVCRGCGQIRSDYLEHKHNIDVLCIDCLDLFVGSGHISGEENEL